MKATYKQLNFIKSLLEKADMEFPELLDNIDSFETDGISETYELTIEQASSCIEFLKERLDME